jgi:hypothetical protein
LEEESVTTTVGRAMKTMFPDTFLANRLLEVERCRAYNT